MEARVNDFLNEINEIVPPVTQVHSTAECVWQECFDDSTGFPYYWNMLTNAVTWEIPPEYQDYLDKAKAQKDNEKASKMSGKPLFPSVTSSNLSIESKTISASGLEALGPSEVKKIKALPAYMLDSDHDSQDAISKNGSNTNSPFRTNSKSNSQDNSDAETPDEVKPTLGFSLLANYGNYSDEDSQNETEDNTTKVIETRHSVLFPATQPIDVKQFEQEPNQNSVKSREKIQEKSEEIDIKVFKRKRRLGVHLVNHPKNESKVEESGESEKNADKESLIKKFGMTFVQGDTLEPTISQNVPNQEQSEATNAETETEGTSAVIKEKLAFLSEGREAVSPVQIMSIQLEILFSAWKSGNLNSSYFSSWIKTICNDLIKLEEDATPEGWNLEWDRQEKRYFYRNKVTEVCQWEYPQEHSIHVVNGDGEMPTEERKVLEEGEVDDEDDAMDICTTPPPMDAATEGSNIEVTTICGAATEEVGNKNVNLDLTSALDSFYSDIAAIETATQDDKFPEPTMEPEPQIINSNILAGHPVVEVPKRRKKVKMTHGISMKKKGVSELVEKWKNVQKDLD